MHIAVKRGLNIPIKGAPVEGAPKTLAKPKEVSLNLSPFKTTKFKLLIKEGEAVLLGQPIAQDKSCPKRLFVAPASGVVKEVRRGLKRQLMDIVIAVDQEETSIQHPLIDLKTASNEALIDLLSKGGVLPHIRKRPFNLFADPNKLPNLIFVNAIETAPFIPSGELQVQGYEKEFQLGLDALKKLSPQGVHLVYKQHSHIFPSFHGITHHTVEGPHPAGNTSLHIHHIAPVQNAEDVIWTLNTHDVITIGHLIKEGRYHTKLILSIAGPAILEGRTGYFHSRRGYPIQSLIEDRVDKHAEARLISGDPLTGSTVQSNDFLGFLHTSFTAIPEDTKREFLHFFKLGMNKYSFSRAYLSGFFKNAKRMFSFTTNQHGESRPFIEGRLYDQVMPLDIHTIPLIKAVMAKDFDLAEALGLLEVDSEDFALPTFVCPSKIEMTEIIKEGLQQHATEVLE